MIYSPVAPDSPVRQGDLFRNVPRVDFSLNELSVVEQNDTIVATRWADLPQVQELTPDPVTAVLSLRPVLGIVLTQDCDAIRSPDIALAEVVPFRQAERSAERVEEGSESWVRRIVQHAKINQKWFYLPKDASIEFAVPMAADFRSILRVGRSDLEEM
ncbi:MAG: hypothetical protein HY654_02090, partial [Acidobacteria bacterium]|nr:hypothetical protein [Acidobacteriota bacterium]